MCKLQQRLASLHLSAYQAHESYEADVIRGFIWAGFGGKGGGPPGSGYCDEALNAMNSSSTCQK